MKYKRLGRTNLNISEIAYGGLALFFVERDEAIRLLNKAIDLGINYIDCDEAGSQFVPTRVYEDTRNKLGEVLKSRRHEVYVGIKCMFSKKDEVARDIDRALEYIFKGTGSEVIDLFHLAHVDVQEKLDLLLSPQGGLAAVEEAKRAGKIKHLLVASHNPAVLLSALQTGLFDVAEFPFTIIEDEYKKDVIPYCQAHDIGTVIMKPIGGGQMASCASLSLRWIKEQPVDVIIPGMKTMEELLGNVDAVVNGGPLSAAELSHLEQTARVLGSEYCHRCGYCLPCPKNIHIISQIDLYRSNLIDLARKKELYRSQRDRRAGVAADCIACGMCVEKCPFKLPVPELMKKIAAALEA
ncbi:MAG: aldo/keto reductase [Pseudomonadota bacterium]